jgi:hypothetical protein
MKNNKIKYFRWENPDFSMVGLNFIIRPSKKPFFNFEIFNLNLQLKTPDANDDIIYLAKDTTNKFNNTITLTQALDSTVYHTGKCNTIGIGLGFGKKYVISSRIFFNFEIDCKYLLTKNKFIDNQFLLGFYTGFIYKIGKRK